MDKFKCPFCSGTKFHATVYHELVDGELRVLSGDTELRCVNCHEVYLLRNIVKTVNEEHSQNFE